ncbi:MAG: HEAT repeat domain-containing protein [Myxococcota bacterium]|nr:HEAT repeat domain-containing protein [Myxococcota bacterium]
MRKAWMISASCLLAVALMAPMSSARSQSTEEAQRRVLLQLLNAHEFKVNRKAFDRIGPEVNRLLVNISGDPRQRPTVRVRATSALSVYPSDRTRRYLNGALFDPELKKNRFGLLQRREAMMSLAAAFKGDAVQTLVGFHEDDDPQIREGCARALGISGSARALPTLNAWLTNEPEIFVRQAIDEAIEKLGEDTRR